MPDRLHALATEKVLRSRAAPELTVTEPVPKAPLVIAPVDEIPAFRIPFEMVVPPEKVLAPDKVSVPVPSLVKVPLPVAIGSFTAISPLPPKVTLILLAVIPLPLATSKVNVPLSELILAAFVDKVIAP